ncbi:TPA: glycosyltransferase [Klebsiella aerogenes]|nr:glycosyltransferase [Klebsiella aerogenes]
MRNKKNLWVLGPRDKKLSGIGLYSTNLIKGLSSKGYIDDVLYIPFKSRSVMRYLYQFIYLPIYLMLFSYKYKHVILYEEAYSFLIPFCDLFKKRAVLIFHHVPEENSADSLIEKLKYFYMKIVMLFTTFSRTIVFPSEFSRQAYLTTFQSSGKAKGKVRVVIPNSFDFSNVIDSGMPGNNPATKEHIISFLYVGSEEARKNLNVAVSALAELGRDNNIRFTKIGKPIVEENREELLAILSDSALEYKIIDFADNQNLEFYLSSCDFFIMPSLHEGFGRTPIEAQYHGKLVIASDIPVLRETMGDSAIYVPQPHLIESWVKIMKQVILLDDAKLYDYRTKARINARRYSVENITSKFIDAVIER